MIGAFGMVFFAAEDGGAAEKAGLPQMDASTFPSQIFWLAISFGFLYFVVSALVLPGLSGAITVRRNTITGDLDKAAALKARSESAEKSYVAAVADAKSKARMIAGETRDRLNAELSVMQKEADDRAAAAVAKAEARIIGMKKNAAEKVRDAAADTTKALVEILIDETPGADQVASAVSKAAASQGA